MKYTDFVEEEQILDCRSFTEQGLSLVCTAPCPADMGAGETLLQKKSWHCLLTWLHVADLSSSMTSLFFSLSPAESPEGNVYLLYMVSCDKILQANFCSVLPARLHCLQQDRTILTDLVLSETDLTPMFTVIFGRTTPLTRAGLKHWSVSLTQGQGHISASGTKEC